MSGSRSSGETTIGAFVEALLAADPDARLAAAADRSLFDYLTCLEAGRRAAPPWVGDAAAAAWLDRDDIHWPSLTHPGAVIWTVIARAQASPARAVRAAAIGYEVTARLAIALGADHRRSWHATTTAGTVGGSVAAAIGLGLDRRAVINAAGHALSVMGGSATAVLERSPTRFVYRDHAVATAFTCADNAALAATHEALEGANGLAAAMGSGGGLRLEAPSGPWAIEETAFRLHAASGFAHAAIEAAQELAPVTAPAVVTLELPPAALALASSADPTSDEDAWWSTPYAVAVTLLGLELEDRSLLHDERVRRLLAAFEIRPGRVSRVTVGDRAAARAEPRRATDDDLLRKWQTLNPGGEAPLQLPGLTPGPPGLGVVPEEGLEPPTRGL